MSAFEITKEMDGRVSDEQPSRMLRRPLEASGRGDLTVRDAIAEMREILSRPAGESSG